jgi:hypothetical protein
MDPDQHGYIAGRTGADNRTNITFAPDMFRAELNITLPNFNVTAQVTAVKHRACAAHRVTAWMRLGWLGRRPVFR